MNPEYYNGYIPLSVTFFASQYDKKGNITLLGITRGTDHTNIGMVGGKCEINKSPEDAVIREVYEESGIVIFNPIPIFSRFDYKKDFLCITFTSNQIVLPEKGFVPNGEGTPGWYYRHEFLNENSCTFCDYNRKLFEQLDIV